VSNPRHRQPYDFNYSAQYKQAPGPFSHSLCSFDQNLLFERNLRPLRSNDAPFNQTPPLLINFAFLPVEHPPPFK
jgi:hypothetical protein